MEISQDSGSYVLLKFFGEKRYAEEFLNGSLYMNTLNFFQEQNVYKRIEEFGKAHIPSYPETFPESGDLNNVRRLAPLQADILEGTVFSRGTSLNLTYLEKDFGGSMLTDPTIRSIGYQYCNILCFYMLDYHIKKGFPFNIVDYNIPEMKDFGKYVVIIDDEQELINRIGKAANKLDFKYLCGKVNYIVQKKNGTISEAYKKHHLLIKQEGTIYLDEEMRTSIRDCFNKDVKYCKQHEWRVALYRGRKDIDAYRLQIGNIRDIAHIIKADILSKDIDRLFLTNNIKPSLVGYYGNISRREMKNTFITLGDNKAEIFISVGYSPEDFKS